MEKGKQQAGLCTHCTHACSPGPCHGNPLKDNPTKIYKLYYIVCHDTSITNITSHTDISISQHFGHFPTPNISRKWLTGKDRPCRWRPTRPIQVVDASPQDEAVDGNPLLPAGNVPAGRGQRVTTRGGREEPRALEAVQVHEQTACTSSKEDPPTGWSSSVSLCKLNQASMTRKESTGCL